MRLSLIASIRRLDQVTRRFRDDRRGLAAVEFALIVPLMLMMVFGTIEITNGIAVKRKIDLVSRTLSDLTSRASTLSSTDVTSFFTVGSAIMQPYGSSLAATISEVYIDPITAAGSIIWSQASGGGILHAAGSPVSVPSGLISKDAQGKVVANQYLIYAEASYLYVPAVGYVMNKAGITLAESTFTRPRQSNSVTYTP